MLRATAALLLLATLADVSSACPRWGRRCQSRPVVVYSYCPPPVVVYTPCPPPAIVAQPQPVTATIPPSQPAALAEEIVNWTAVYERAVRSCVFIVTPKRGAHPVGSGALIDAEKRLVITTYHAVDDEDVVFVQFPIRQPNGSWMTDQKKYIIRIPAGEAIKGKVLFRDSTRDLALVELARVPPDTPALPLGSGRLLVTGSVITGEQVIHIGTHSTGKKAFARADHLVNQVSYERVAVPLDAGVLHFHCRLVTTTTPAATDDSGGPIIDKRGRLVAVSEGRAVGAVPNVLQSLDGTEVRAFLKEKKVQIKETDAEPEATKPPAKPGPGRDAQPPGKPKGDAAVVGAPTEENEKAAAQSLRRAKLFASDPDSRDYYLSKLKEVIKKYPGTAAAKEAQKILDGPK
jgi:Trypsin-like peptidase domain